MTKVRDMYEQMVCDMNDFNDLLDKIATFRTEQADIQELEQGYYESVYEYMTDLSIEELQEIAEQIGMTDV